MIELVLLASLAFADPNIAWESAPNAGPHAPFEAVALSWSGAADRELRVRASADGRTWGAWLPVHLAEDLSDPDQNRYFSAIVHFGTTQRYIETSASDVTLTLFSPQERRPRVKSDTVTMGDVVVRTRTDWGCPDGQGAPRWTPGYTTVTHAIVHHTAGSNTVTDWEAEMRAIWYFHNFTRGWGDIGYNFLIDPNGVVYEGRSGGDGAIGAHFSCRNTNTVGVALLGTYTSVTPTAAAMDSLRKLLAELLRRNSLDAASTALHVPSDLMIPRISSHRDGNPSPRVCTVTSCPGDALYAMLPALRSSLVLHTPAGPRRRSVAPPR